MTTTHDVTQPTDVARGHAQDAAQDAKARAAEVGSHANDAAHDVASTAVDQAQQVKAETVRQARNLFSEATDQLSAQAGSQTQRLSGNLRDLGDELRQMADAGHQGGTARELAHQAAERAHQVAGYLEGRQPDALLDDLRSYARRRPGAFLAGAAVLGLVAGRVGRGVKDADPPTTRAGSAAPAPAESSPTTSTTPLTAPPGESIGLHESAPIAIHDDDRTVDLTDDYRSTPVDPVSDWDAGRR